MTAETTRHGNPIQNIVQPILSTFFRAASPFEMILFTIIAKIIAPATHEIRIMALLIAMLVDVLELIK